MTKTKFIISGMHCASCATLIEDRIKVRPGVVSVKVNHESGKAIVVFDESKSSNGDFVNVIKESGNYQVEEEKEEEPVPNQDLDVCSTGQLSARSAGSTPNSFVWGFLVGVGIFSLILNLIMGMVLYKGLLAKNDGVSYSSKPIAKAQEAPPAPSPAPAPQKQNPPPIQNFEITKKDHVRGSFDAPITLVEFSDFECPYCGRHYPTLKKVLADYAGKVRLVYKHFPLSFHPNSQKAAEASECADEQGKFWEYHDKLFENQADGFSVDKFKQWAQELGLNAKKFNDCLDADKYAAKIEADIQEGASKGVNGTPANFINGQLISGALPYEAFKQVLDGLINK